MPKWSYAEDPPVSAASKGLSKWSYAEEQKPETFLQKLPRNVGAGLANLGHSIINAPHDIAQNFNNQNQEWQKALNEKGLSNFNIPRVNFDLANAIPHQKDYNFAEMLGQKGEPTLSDSIVQKGIQYSPEILGGANVVKNLFPYLTRKGASRTLAEARKLAAERNIAPIEVDSELIKDAAQFLPKTTPYKNALKDAQTGDYNALFKLQSDLGRHAGDYAGSKFSAAERSHGKAGMATRNALLDEIHKGLQSQGHHDISNLLRLGQKEYARYMRFKPLRNKIIKGVAYGGLGTIALPHIPIVNHLLRDSLMSGIK